MLWGFIGISALLVARAAPGRGLLLIVASMVTLHLYTLPTDARVSSPE